MDQGLQDIENTKYKNEILARTRAGMERNTALEEAQKGILNPDGSINDEQWGKYAALDAPGALDIRSKAQPKQAKWELKQIGDGTPGGLLDAWVNPDTQEMRDLQGNVISGGLLGQQGPQLGDGRLGAPAPGGFDQIIGGLLEREGGYVADDAGAGPTNFGINSRANPGIDVRSLTPETAKDIYKAQYWDKINADNLPPAIQSAAFDAAVNQGPGRAKEWLAMAGNDPQQFAKLRQQHYDSLVQQDPAKYGKYADSWRSRNQETA